jgi:hypothetical protein
MGSTFVDYRGRGFYACDAVLEVWLALLVKEIDELDNPLNWLTEVRQDWQLQATAGFGFGVLPELDRYATDDERRAVILDLAARAKQKLRDRGPVITRDELNAMGLGGEGAVFTADLPAKLFLDTACDFTKLIRGTLETSPAEESGRDPHT